MSERESDAGPAPVTFGDDIANLGDQPVALGDADPHSVRSVEPNHGSFTGGSRVLIRGTGFGSGARVWFGDTLLPESDVVAIDPRRLQAVSPPGDPGVVAVTVQNGDDASTRRTLPTGYQYDAFYVDPSTAPVNGGTTVTLYGKETSWDASTEVLIDLKPCAVHEVRDGTGGVQELDCVVPEGTPGSKPVRVTADGMSVDVLDAFVYADSDDGFRGGFGGAALSGSLRVIVLDDSTGQPIPGASVVLGDAAAGSALVQADPNGVAQADWDLSTATVTAAASCYHPTTFVNVPVDAVTIYLAPLLTPACIPEGDPPATGGATGTSSSVSGEIVFTGGVEFKRALWNVPTPGDSSGEKVAYVLSLSHTATSSFRLPSSSSAITPDADGRIGYAFHLGSRPGNLTLYALAGIENRDLDPPLFTAYSMGLITGVRVDPGQLTEDVYITMDNLLDRALTIEADGPSPTSRGPDHLRVGVSLRFGRLGYAILPNASGAALLPNPGPIDIVGLPPLTGSLADARYVVAATADTGLASSPPRSVIGLYAPEVTATHVFLDGFVEVPVLEAPAPGTTWDGTELVVGAAPGGPDANLLVAHVHGAADSFRWVIVAPGGAQGIHLPDPASIPGFAMPSGSLTIEVNRARIDGFDYSQLGYGHLRTRAWNAYATDTVTVARP
jgi:hypothetical protein